MHFLLAITGSIAAIKTPELIRILRKNGHSVQCILTNGGEQFSSKTALEALTEFPVLGPQIFTHNLSENPYAHINISKSADALCIAPASAHTIARLAQGMADDFLSATVLASSCPIFLAPAMNHKMWEHPATQQNIKKLQEYGYTIISPENGEMACGDEGTGRMAEISDILAFLERVNTPQTLKGKTVLISLGGTRENLDPVRFIGNASSGKMGNALAEIFWKKGATVKLCAGMRTEHLSSSRFEISETLSTSNMCQEMERLAPNADIVVFAAAVADFTPLFPLGEKQKSGKSLVLELSPTVDIAKKLAETKQPHQIFIGFALETDEKILKTEMMKKAEAKKFDIVLGNTEENLGSDTGTYLFWSKDAGTFEEFSGTKEEVAEKIALSFV
ncbi:MAG: bifunctional phosphopantothenoylcysteine decarboxylase/phosphopantothenate--cysteine ligase CoaBC [Candidatus Peregrinibacteria bacterium]